MKDPIYESIKDFLDKNMRGSLEKGALQKGPLLLGYSGGYDSKALLYLLCEYKNSYGLDLHLAHVDHKWRDSSTKEALQLKEEAEALKLPFHLRTLEGIHGKANIEAYCRELRLIFFEELYKKYSCQAILLAHHKDDLSETVLKRVLEGADLSFLKGMEKHSSLREMNIWRPLLDFPKNELLKLLERNQLDAIDDVTNRDNRYLRSRIRQEIIPSLSSYFGKEVSKNLALISKRSIELKEYLDKTTKKYFDLRISGPFGVFIDFSKMQPGLDIEPVEIKHLVRRIGNSMAIELSRDVIERIMVTLIEGKNLALKLKMADLIIQNNILFILTDSEFSLIDDKMRLSEGKTILNRWEINVAEECNTGEYNKDKTRSFSSWKDLLKGQFEVMLPKHTYFLGRPSLDLSYYNKRLSKWFSENKVPTFMRFSFPVIFKDDKMFYEFLSGKKRFKESTSDGYYRISFRLSCLKQVR